MAQYCLTDAETLAIIETFFVLRFSKAFVMMLGGQAIPGHRQVWALPHFAAIIRRSQYSLIKLTTRRKLHAWLWGKDMLRKKIGNIGTAGKSRWFIQAERGFTLLELLVVMVIIGLLAGYVGPKYFSQIGKSEIKAARAQIDALGKALEQYRLDTGKYPSSEEGLSALVARPASEPKWDGPYLAKKVPLDPWGNPYLYKYPGEHGDYDLISNGKDGQPGGEGEAADITNW